MPKAIVADVGAEGKQWQTALFKEAVRGSVCVRFLGLDGDGQADLESHGGLDKAINAYPSEHYQYWLDELGLACEPGAFGENFSSDGMIEAEVCVGDIYRVGELVVQVSQPRQPCWKIARRWGVKKLALFVQQTGKTGWYYRVLKEAQVSAPDVVELIDRPYPQWTIDRVNQIMYRDKRDWQAAYDLSQCSALSESWKVTLSSRAAKQQCHSELPRLYGV